MSELLLTAVWFLISAGIGAVAFIRSTKPKKNDLEVRMLPWRFIMILGVFSCILAVTHLYNVLGHETGAEHNMLKRY